MKKFFGTDGIRGKINDETINPEFAYKLGWVLVDYCLKKNLKPLIIVGRDTRESGLLLESAVMRGIAAKGGKAFSAGVITTPGISFLVSNEKAGLGLMISASHNPYEYNGFKIFKSDGTKLTDEEEEEIEKLIEDVKGVTLAKNFIHTEISGNSASKAAKYVDKYIDFLIKTIPEKNFSGMKLILDCAHGSTFKIAPRVFRALGAEVITLFDNPDGKNINNNCGSQFTKNLEKEVLMHRADIGFAFDGDGDRLSAVTDKGMTITGDHLLYIFSKMFLEKNILKNKLIVSTAMSNLGLINALNEIGISHITSPDVGDRSVFFEMKKQKAILGGEEAGHIIFSDILVAGDGILSGLMLVQAVKYFNQPLLELADQLKLFPKILLNISVNKKPELSSVPEISKIIKKTEDYLGKAGRVFVRYSGTEPLCRVMVEGKEEKIVNNLAQKIAAVIKTQLN